MPKPNRSHGGPRFSARIVVNTDDRSKAVYIDDDDFGYDATLKLTGDFSNEERVRYARAIAKALNAADIPVHDDTQADGEVNADR